MKVAPSMKDQSISQASGSQKIQPSPEESLLSILYLGVCEVLLAHGLYSKDPVLAGTLFMERAI